jgi:hypothetical protein
MYGANVCLSPTCAMLLRRLRRAIDQIEEDGCVLTDSELIARGLSLQLECVGVSGHTNAAMLTGREAEPCLPKSGEVK